MLNFQRTLVTAALPYANGAKHIGHLAGAYIPADIYTRFLRNCGKNVLFVCGSDEHGTAIPIQAKEEGLTSQQLIDKYHLLLKTNFEQLGIAFDVYHRTSDELHHQTAQEFFLDLYHKGLFVEEISQQFYDEEANTFLADRYIKGTCPNCAYESAYGDQCEKCGKALSPDELINPKSTISGNEPIKKETKHWYLPLQNYEPWLKEWLVEGKKNQWRPTVYGQSKSWIDGGLNLRAMTRDLDWGVKVPINHADGKVLYVWFDAPIGYISATKSFFEEIESKNIQYSYPENSTIKEGKKEDWKIWWQNNDTELVHFIGKDNIVFHCIIFPAMLKAAGNYVLPNQVPANEFLNLEGEKMSTSRKWNIEMDDFLKHFSGQEDVLRYVLTAIAPETKDSDFSWKEFQTRNNSELVAILANFVHRVFVLIHKFYDGKVPSTTAPSNIEENLINDCLNISKEIEANLLSFKFRDALFSLLNMARIGNKYLGDTEPWKLIKTEPEKAAIVLNHALQICAHLSWWMEPFLPFTSKKLVGQLNIEFKKPLEFFIIKNDHTINAPQHLFSNIDDVKIELAINDLVEKSKKNMNQEETNIETNIKTQKPEITFDDFQKMDIRIGKILEAEKVKKADKLLHFKVDLGYEIRDIVSGIALFFKPEEMIGKNVVVLANLAPRMIKGIESKGMILMAEDQDGKLQLISPINEIAAGSCVN